MLSENLWQANMDIAKGCLEHPMVRGLGEGTLDRNVFREYITQDAFFLRAFLKAYSIAGAKCDDWNQTRKFHGLMTGILDELEMHDRFARSLAIDLEQTEPHPATLAYTDFLLRTAWHGSVPELLAAMVPCLRLYAFLGKQLSRTKVSINEYQDWIDTYAADDFHGLCALLESMLNDLGEDSRELRQAYRYAMQCELDFFSAPLEILHRIKHS